MMPSTKMPAVNNHFYDELDERWYNDDEHIIALLRAESFMKNAYVTSILREQNIHAGSRILDVGCGAGFLSNHLAKLDYKVVGVDQSASSLAVARRHAPAESGIRYATADAYALDELASSFDAVLLMDFLEHVDEPARVIREAARVLRPGGVMIFYTFNRTMLAKFLAIHAVHVIARDCPKNFHVWHLFIKPHELKDMATQAGLAVGGFRGLRPNFLHWPFWSSLLTRRVHPDFRFQYTSNLEMGYMGFAVKVQS